MNKIYEAHSGTSPEMRTHLGCISAWSNQGLVAYTCERIIENKPFMELHIFNSQIPWDEYSVPFRVGREITSLSWNHAGDQLVVGDSLGRVLLFTMRDNSPSDWSKNVVIDEVGDSILVVGWLHNGIKHEIHIDKVIPAPGTDPTSLADKIIREKFTSSLFDFGGSAIDGVFAVTRTGRIIFKTEGLFEPEKNHYSHQLCPVDQFLMFADYACQPNGSIVIALSTGIVSQPVRFVRLNLSKKNPFQIENRSRINHEITIESEEMCSLWIPKDFQENPSGDVFLTDLQFPHREYADQIIINISNERQSCLSWWMLRQEQVTLPAVLGGNTNVQCWKCHGKNTQLPRITSMTSHSLPVLTAKFFDSVFSCGNLLAVSCQNGTLHLVQKLTLQTLLTIESYKDISTQNNTEIQNQSNSIEDNLRAFVSLSFSPTGCAIFGMDSSARITIMQVKPWLDTEVPISRREETIQLLIEYSILCDIECWDVRYLLSDLNIIMNIESKLAITFKSHEKYEPYRTRCEAERILLYIQIPQLGEISEYSKLLSHLLSSSILRLFCSLLKPSPANTDAESEASEELRDVAESRTDSDIDATLTPLIPRFETDTKLLQAIGHLIQWVADHILYQISNIRKLPPELDEVSTSRQLLLVIKLWSLLLLACTPQFTIKDAKIDIIAESFKLLTEVWIILKEKKEMPPQLADRCERLRGRVYVEKPYIEPSLRANLKGHVFEIGKFPAVFNNQVAISRDEMDFVRRTKMGINEIRQLRRCARSGVCTQNRHDSPLAVWDHRFLKRSLCGGLWTRAAPRARKRQAKTDLVQEILK